MNTNTNISKILDRIESNSNSCSRNELSEIIIKYTNNYITIESKDLLDIVFKSLTGYTLNQFITTEINPNPNNINDLKEVIQELRDNYWNLKEQNIKLLNNKNT